MAITDYSSTPSLNKSIGGIDVDEGCSPANLNNAFRQLMADSFTAWSAHSAALATGTVAALVGTRVYATQAALYADLAHAAGLFALVYADPVANKNDLYVKSGASGAGSWSAPLGIFANAVAAYAEAASDSADAAAASAAAAAATAAELEDVTNELLAVGNQFNFLDTPETFVDSAYVTDRDYYQQTSTLARVVYSTSATRMRVHGYTNIIAGFPAFAGIGVRVNGVHREIKPTADGMFSGDVVLPSGAKTVEIINSLQDGSNGANALRGSYVVTVEANAPLARPALPVSNRTVFLVDSIGSGANATVPTRDSYISLLRRRTSDSITVYGWGFNSLSTVAGTPTARTALVAILAALNPTRIVNTLGLNDFGLATMSAASFQTAYAALNDAIHTALPTALIYAVRPILAGSETANAFGDTLGAYRTAITSAAVGRSWVTVVNGEAFMTTGSLADGTHPTSAGHQLWAAGIAPVLGYSIPAAWGTAVLTATDGNGTVTQPGGGVFRATKTAGGDAFNSGFHGAMKEGDFRYSVTLSGVISMMAGVSAAPQDGSSYTDMLHQVYSSGAGLLNNYDGATNLGSAGSFVGGDLLWIDRTANTLTFKAGATYAGATTLRSIENLAGAIGLDLSIYTGGAVVDVVAVS